MDPFCSKTGRRHLDNGDLFCPDCHQEFLPIGQQSSPIDLTTSPATNRTGRGSNFTSQQARTIATQRIQSQNYRPNAGSLAISSRPEPRVATGPGVRTTICFVEHNFYYQSLADKEGDIRTLINFYRRVSTLCALQPRNFTSNLELIKDMILPILSKPPEQFVRNIDKLYIGTSAPDPSKKGSDYSHSQEIDVDYRTEMYDKTWANFIFLLHEDNQKTKQLHLVLLCENKEETESAISESSLSYDSNSTHLSSLSFRTKSSSTQRPIKNEIKSEDDDKPLKIKKEPSSKRAKVKKEAASRPTTPIPEIDLSDMPNPFESPERPHITRSQKNLRSD